MRKIIIVYVSAIYIFPLVFVMFYTQNYYILLSLFVYFAMIFFPIFTLLLQKNLNLEKKLSLPNVALTNSIIINFLIMLYAFLNIKYTGGFVVAFLNGGLLEYMLKTSSMRYEGTLDVGLMKECARYVLFVLGFMFGTMRLIKYHIIIIILILINVSLGLARTGILLFFLNYCMGYLYSRLDYIKYISFKIIIFRTSQVFLIIILLFAISAALRLTTEDLNNGVLFKKMLEYSLGMYFAHGEWLLSVDNLWPVGNFNCCGIIKNIFNIEQRSGMFVAVVSDFGRTNIFLNGRILWEDFGYVGWLFIGFLLGIVVCLFDYEKLSLQVKSFFIVIIPVIFYPFYVPYYFSNYSISIIFIVLYLLIALNYIPPKQSEST